MKPEQFIREFGVEKAREVVEGAPERATHLLNGEYVRVSDPRWILDGYVSIADINRLVESVFLVKEHYTLDRAKAYAASPFTAPELKERLQQAIADYEAIYSGAEQ
ncbi:hypothetical protein RMB13_07160 [Acinetobacter sp. V102_4]|uniref:hypothetical protein n=1 Tax=Acinetobacter sp. V102_4 TaxID=3072984 RepID=UPI00287E2CF3|nr:hypothetical protein [Acinetobacter sp. V102_4]MDS7929256.1 hypothetical protein [Acinetobacter sp. V102_4]